MKQLIFLSVGLILFAVVDAHACSCSATQTVDREFSRSENVAIFKLESVVKSPDTGRITSAVFNIEKVYKGDLKVGTEHVLLQGGGADCIWTFEENEIGDEFLFYLGKSAGMAVTCGRSNELKHAAADLKYLDNIGDARGRTRISGVISQHERVVVQGEKARWAALKDHSVRITGNGRDLTLKTDENGAYEIYDLRPGQYRIELGKLKGYQAIAGYSIKPASAWTINLLSHSQAEMNFTFGIQNKVSGRVSDADGNLVGNVLLMLEPANGERYDYFVEIARSDRNGEFNFENVPAGRYVIVGNEKNEVTPDNPFPKFYSSGTSERSTATEFTVSAGQVLDGLMVKTSRPADVVDVSGKLLYEDGIPAAGTTVKFVAERPSVADSYAFVDNAGNFRIRLLKDQRGVIFAYVVASDYMYPNCKDKIAVAKKKAHSVEGEVTLQTRPEEFVAKANTTGVEIKFPFALCSRR